MEIRTRSLNIRFLPITPLRLSACAGTKATAKRRYRVKAEFWGWLAIGVSVLYVTGHLVYAVINGRL